MKILIPTTILFGYFLLFSIARADISVAGDLTPEEEIGAQILAAKIAENASGDADQFMSYARCLVKTLGQFTSSQRADAIGYDPVPQIGDAPRKVKKDKDKEDKD
ncbi:MAG: hypothetical protein ACI8UO_004464 [Verrucomicrobiales bacterium]|jgi:hypothetical protein